MPTTDQQDVIDESTADEATVDEVTTNEATSGEVTAEEPTAGQEVAADSTPEETSGDTQLYSSEGKPLPPIDEDDPWARLRGLNDAEVAALDTTPAEDAVLRLGSRGYSSDGFHFRSGSSGSAHVETESIRKTAELAKKRCEAIAELIQEMNSYVSASDSYWKGYAGDEFRKSVEGGVKYYLRCLELFSTHYVRELIAYADRYDDVITEANAIAADLDDVIWGDV